MTKKKKAITDPVSISGNPVAIKPAMITGYQYGEHGTFISAYHFEKNRDKEALHCPPCTTLLAPPTNLDIDQEAHFDGQQWQVRRLTLPWLPDRTSPPLKEVNHDH